MVGDLGVGKSLIDCTSSSAEGRLEKTSLGKISIHNVSLHPFITRAKTIKPQAHLSSPVARRQRTLYSEQLAPSTLWYTVVAGENGQKDVKIDHTHSTIGFTPRVAVETSNEMPWNQLTFAFTTLAP